ncbi:MAG: DUF2254 domain-containing protein [Syntrophobacteraceae bacterium]
MQWNRRYVIKSYIRASLWLVPFFAVVLYVVFHRITYGIGGWLLRTGQIDEKTAFFGLTMVGARSALDTIVTLNLSFLVFTFGSLLVAIQIAGGQYTPRIIATTLLRDNAIRFTVGYFVFTMLFTVRVLNKMGGEIVHQFNTFIAVMLGLVSIVVFLYLIDHAARLLRPVSIVKRVGESGLAVIQSVYPESTTRPHPVKSSHRPASLDRTFANLGASGIVLAVDLNGLVAQARNANGVIEFVPQVGDFVAADEPLFLLYGGAGAIDDRHLVAAVALGSERTVEQDPTFAFRILVDIAIKALSPAINDPTTAVLAIDQLHRLLRRVGLRLVSREEIHDDAGELRLIFRTPNWEDFVHLTCTEIRHCGASSIQIMRRVRSMLENLMQTLPPHRHDELRKQLELLDRTVEEHYSFPEDRVLARIPDSQGLGGSLGLPTAFGVPNADGREK